MACCFSITFQCEVHYFNEQMSAFFDLQDRLLIIHRCFQQDLSLALLGNQ